MDFTDRLISLQGMISDQMYHGHVTCLTCLIQGYPKIACLSASANLLSSSGNSSCSIGFKRYLVRNNVNPRLITPGSFWLWIVITFKFGCAATKTVPHQVNGPGFYNVLYIPGWHYTSTALFHARRSNMSKLMQWEFEHQSNNEWYKVVRPNFELV